MSPRRLLVIGWHNVGPTPYFDDRPGAGERMLRHQLGWLRRFTNVLPLDEGLRRLAESCLPHRAVALTFDDGYQDNLEIASREVISQGLSASFFLCPSFLDGGHPWWERLAAALRRWPSPVVDWQGAPLRLDGPTGIIAAAEAISERLKLVVADEREAEVTRMERIAGTLGEAPVAMLDWAGARQLARRGHGIGSHSMRHAILSRESAGDQCTDLAESRRLLESGLQRRVDTLAYPNGRSADFNENTVAAAQASGYRASLTTITGRNSVATPRHEIRRLVVSCNDSPRMLATEIKACWQAERTNPQPSRS